MKEHSMQHIPGAAGCRGLVGLVFGHRFDPLMTVRTDSDTDSGSQVREERIYADGAVCRRCGAAVMFYGGDDDGDDGEVPSDPPLDADDEPEPGMPVVDGDFLRTV